jgi:cytidyltransferase-like protein
MKILLTEGGNIFEETQRINKVDVVPTVKWLEGITGLKLQDSMLGTTGEKETSGDLDLGVDEKTITKDELVNKLKNWAVKNKIPEDKIFNTSKTKTTEPFKHGWIAKTGTNVHFKTPINGNFKNGFVQTDFMFTPDMEWTKYSLKGTPEISSPFKGAEKHMLLGKLAKVSNPSRPMSWSYLNGLLDSETREVISKNPDEMAKLILGSTATGDTLRSVERILQYIKNNNLYDKFKQQIEAFRVERGFSEEDINKLLAESSIPSFKKIFLKEQSTPIQVGFFPGAFKPLHKGHIEAIKKAANQVSGPFFVIVSKNSRASEEGMEFSLEQTLELFKIYKDILPDNVHVLPAGISPLSTVLQTLVILNNGKFVLGKPPKNADPNQPLPDPETLIEPETKAIISSIPPAEKYVAKLAVGDDPKDLNRYQSAFKNIRYVGKKLQASTIETIKGWSATIFRNGLDQLNKEIIQEYIPVKPEHPTFMKILDILYKNNPKLKQAINLFKKKQ